MSGVADHQPQSKLIEGKIIRKKKRPDSWVLAVKPSTRVSIPVHIPIGHEYDFLFLFAIIEVKCHQKERAVWADEIRLVQCAPYPAVIPIVLEGIVSGKYTLSVIPTLPSVEEAQRVLDMPAGRQKRVTVAEIIRVLEGRVAYKPPRVRPPYVKQREWQVLEELERVGTTGEHGWKIQTIEPKEYNMFDKVMGDSKDDGDDDDGKPNHHDDMPLNIPEAPVGDEMPVGKGSRTREDYIRNKKIPQVRWMVRRIKDLYMNDKKRGPPKHILDVGGGRGDLSTALAVAFPTSQMTVVDLNQPSLDAGKEYAQSIGCGDRINFVLADMVDFAQQQQAKNSPNIDLVVALHACGDLSDFAISFAIKVDATFVVCPCCYAKRKIPDFVPKWVRLCDENSQTTLRRLCELNEKPEVSRRSMKYINSMRYHGIVEDEYSLTLEQYDIASSTRNHVFVGTR